MNVYEQATGRWYGGNDILMGAGYAGGDCGNDLAGVNNPAVEDIPNVGPLPCGWYKIGAPYNHPKCGEFFIPLTPQPGNEMFGRGGFGVHGDLKSSPGACKASDGCIILALGVRQAIAANLAIDDDLKVVSGIEVFPDVDGEISGAGG